MKECVDIVLKRVETGLFRCSKSPGPHIIVSRKCQHTSEPSELYEVFEVQEGQFELADGKIFEVLKS